MDVRSAGERIAGLLEADPDNLGLQIDLAGLQLQLDQREQATDTVDRLPLDEVTDPGMMFSLAEIFEVLGERAEALKWVEGALQGGYPLDVIEDYAAFDDLRSDSRFVVLAETYREASPEDTKQDPKEGED